jgi:hypothetical protein
MKAWRKEAEKINARRLAGSKEPRARVQKELAQAKPKLYKGSTWLLDGLLIHGGYITPATALPTDKVVPQTYGMAQKIAKAWRNAKRWLGV